MKSNLLHILGSLVPLLVGAPDVRPQGTFLNLDFESANIIPDPGSPYFPHAVSVANALPGWTTYGGTFGGDVIYDTVSLGDAAISIHDSNGSVPVLQGNYTVLFQPTFPSGAVFPAIAQVGTIPATARSLRFYANGFPAVVFSGQQLGLVTLATTPTYSVFGADVSALANQTGELRFTGSTSLDNIFFSPTAIPEPSIIGLAILGVVVIGRRLKQGARSKVRKEVFR